MFGPKMGTWWIRSNDDSRWNKTGEDEGFVYEGGPPEMQKWVNSCTSQYGNPPKDLEYGFMKN